MPIFAVQGFKMMRADLSKFLVANGLPCTHDTEIEPLNPMTEGVSPDEEAEITTVFRRMGIDCKIKIVVPWIDRDNDPSPWVYVCHNWVAIGAHKRIDNELNKPVPESFERLRGILKVQSPIYQYVLVSYEPHLMSDEEIAEQLKVCIFPSCKILLS